MRNVLVVNGHPDPRPERFCAALCDAYLHGAETAGHPSRRLTVGGLPLNETGSRNLPQETAAALDAIGWADRLVMIFPLWLDQAPVMLRNFLQLAFPRPATDFPTAPAARTIVTMEMPAFVHRSMFRGRAPAKGRTLSLPGLAIDEPIFIGSVAAISSDRRAAWLENMRQQGASGV